MNIKQLATTAMLLAGPWALVDQHDNYPINTASELRDWCKRESEATFIGRGLKPYHWSASYSDESNILVAKGQWRIDAGMVAVECRVARGAKEEFASMSIRE